LGYRIAVDYRNWFSLYLVVFEERFEIFLEILSGYIEIITDSILFYTVEFDADIFDVAILLVK